MSRVRRIFICAAALIGSVFASAPSAADAGTYVVHGCRALQGDASWQLVRTGEGNFMPFHSCSQGPARLSVTSNSVAGQSPLGSSIAWQLQAPRDTVFTWLAGQSSVGMAPPSGAFRAQVWDGTTGQTVREAPPYVAGVTPISVALPNLTKVAFGLRCLDFAICQHNGYGFGLTDLQLTVSDEAKPKITPVVGVPAAWYSGDTLALEFAAEDNVGLQSLRIVAPGGIEHRVQTDCFDRAANTELLPCANANRTLAAVADLRNVPDGVHRIDVTATDVVAASTSESYRLLLDRIAPAGPQKLMLDGRDAWRGANQFDVSWANPPVAGTAPISAAEYEFCPAGNPAYETAGCVYSTKHVSTATTTDRVSTPGPGAWTLRVSLRDAAGNWDRDRFATLEPLRYDPVPPAGEFLPFDAQDPSRLVLRAQDALSGIASVEIEVRREGDDAWRSLTVERSGADRFSAVVDDAQLAEGSYEVRARLVDTAGNERSVSQFAGGATLQLKLPVRAASTLAVGKPSRVKVKSARGGRPRYRTVLVERPLTSYGAAVPLEGKLTDSAGNPRAGAAIEVFERVDQPGRDWRYLATIRTTGTGAFVFRALPGPARKLRFAYPGTPVTQPGIDEVELRVRAGITIEPSRRKLRNGNSVVFTGKLRSGPVPEAGKVLTLQALTSRGWRTFGTPRARAGDGRWRFRYQFTGTAVRTRYTFRVLVPAESGYPYAPGRSAVTHVVVNP